MNGCGVDFIGVQKVRWEKDGTEPLADYAWSTDEVKSRLNSGYVSYRSVPPMYNSENTQCVILCAVLCVCETRSSGLGDRAVQAMVCCRFWGLRVLIPPGGMTLCLWLVFCVVRQRPRVGRSLAQRSLTDCVYMCVSCSVIRSNNYRLHLQ